MSVSHTCPHPFTAAVSATVDGPYTLNRTVYPTFSHNPTIARVGPQTYALGYIGCGEGTKIARTGCTNGSTCNATWCWSPTPATSTPMVRADVHPSQQSRGSFNTASLPTIATRLQTRRETHAVDRGTSCDNPHWTGISGGPGPGGPWVRDSPRIANGTVVVNCTGTTPCWHDPAVTNPSFWPLGNRSIVMAYSTGCTDCAVSPGHKHIGLAFGASIHGPFIDLTPHQPIFPFASEDPAIWYDPTNTLGLERWHLFAHTDFSGVAENGTWAHVSAHAVATNPRGPWRVVPDPPYSRAIMWDAHPPTWLETRERPQVIFDRGVPVALSNGAMPGNNSSPWFPHGFTGDWSYTHVQLVDPAEL